MYYGRTIAMRLWVIHTIGKAQAFRLETRYLGCYELLSILCHGETMR